MDDNELIAPRPLSSGDISYLRAVFELQLDLPDEADENAREDAETLIDYALDMIQRGKNVGSVVEEVSG